MSKTQISWRLSGGIPKGMNRDAILNTLRMALRGWQSECNIQFVEERDTFLENDITFMFGRVAGKHVAATCATEGNHHLIIFGEHLTWHPIKTGIWGWFLRVTQRGNDLLTFALHETGHALGLDHSEDLDDYMSVMVASPEMRGLVTRPSDGDGEEARLIWG